MSLNLKVGDSLKAGDLVLLSYGDYSSYGVTGLFRIKRDFVVSAREQQPRRIQSNWVDAHVVPDTSWTDDPTACDEVAYGELWSGGC